MSISTPTTVIPVPPAPCPLDAWDARPAIQQIVGRMATALADALYVETGDDWDTRAKTYVAGSHLAAPLPLGADEHGIWYQVAEVRQGRVKDAKDRVLAQPKMTAIDYQPATGAWRDRER